MPSAWVEHVRKWAKDNDLSYMCAATEPAARKTYQEIKLMNKPKKAMTMIPVQGVELPAPPQEPKRVVIGKTIRVKRPEIVGMQGPLPVTIRMGKTIRVKKPK